MMIKLVDPTLALESLFYRVAPQYVRYSVGEKKNNWPKIDYTAGETKIFILNLRGVAVCCNLFQQFVFENQNGYRVFIDDTRTVHSPRAIVLRF